MNGVQGLFGNITEDFCDELAGVIGKRRVLEVFGGNGYLANRLKKRGIDIHCTSILSGMDGHKQNKFADVEDIRAPTAVLNHGGNYEVLLMCWPTVTVEAEHAVMLWGDARDIVYIGERNQVELGKMGMAGCATDRFHEIVHPTKVLNSYKPKNQLDTAFVGRLNTQHEKNVA